MQSIEPPQVPSDLELNNSASQKKGFFKKLFSRNSQSSVDEKSSLESLPPLDLSINLNDPGVSTDAPNIPSLPEVTFPRAINFESKKSSKSKGKNSKHKKIEISSYDESRSFNWNEPISMQQEVVSDNTKNISFVGKSSGKRKKGEDYKTSSYDASKNFDWTRPITDQDILIHDNNRFNQEANSLINAAESHIEEKNALSGENTLLSLANDSVPSLEPLDLEQRPIDEEIPSLPLQDSDMPALDASLRKSFDKILSNHKLLGKKIDQLSRSKKSDKRQILSLLKSYHELIEKRIEDVETDLIHKKSEVSTKNNELNLKKNSLLKLEKYLKELDSKLKGREEKIDTIITSTVEKELSRRLKIEKSLFKKEISQTKNLNQELKRKISQIQSDREKHSLEHQKLMTKEQSKLTELQTIYDKKLKELDSERKEFEQRKSAALELLKKADSVSSEMEQIKKIKTYIENSKELIRSQLQDDRDLKRAIIQAEKYIETEKDHLDKMFFDKYIQNTLKNISPINPNIKKEVDNSLNQENNPLYQDIRHCKNLLKEKRVNEAKQFYNRIKRSYELSKLPRLDKEALYNAVRELYNEIQLASIEQDLYK